VLEQPSTSSVSFKCQVILAELTGSSTFVHVTIDSGEQLVIEIEGSKSFELDESITAYLDPDDLYGFDLDSGRALFFPIGGGRNG
jgi:ABC-type sugar transport system ATPase subunit